jgi:hypothetical protein
VDPRLILPPAAGSPWAAWARPDIRHCEANLAGWIAAPADTWSNLGYLAAGLWLLRRTKPGPARALGPIALVVGACSFAFHASYTSAGQVLDYAGMFVLTGWILAFGAVRGGWTARARLNAVWAAIVAASLGAYWAFRARGIPVQDVMLAHVLAVSALEARLWLSGRGARSYAPFWAAQALIAAAYACWHLDHADRFCDPANHWFQWHAVWHALTAAAFLPLARFFEGADA